MEKLQYFDILKKLLDSYVVDVSCISFLENTVISFKGPISVQKLADIDGKLMRLLFKKTQIKTSYANIIVHVESDI